MRILNFDAVEQNLVNGLAEYIEKYNLKCMVLGVSGGLDSTITAYICSKVFEKTGKELIGVHLACSTNQNDETVSANLTGEAFCNEYSSVNMEEWYQYSSKFMGEHVPGAATPLTEGNIKARMRMTYLWNLGGIKQGLVMDNDNISENLLGFFTINGDQNMLTVLGGLFKSEIYEFAKHIVKKLDGNAKEAVQHAIDIIPTDGNGVLAGGDMAQIMSSEYTYYDADKILYDFVWDESVDEESRKIKYDEYCKEYSKEMVDKVLNRNKNSEFKRRRQPIVINPLTGNDEG